MTRQEKSENYYREAHRILGINYDKLKKEHNRLQEKLIEAASWLRQIAYQDHDFTKQEIKSVSECYFEEILDALDRTRQQTNV